MALDPDAPELQAWIRLSLEPGLKTPALQLLLSVFGLPQDICAASTGSLARYLSPTLAARLSQPPDAELQTRIEHTLRWLHEAPGRTLLTYADPDYPKSLFDTADPPPMLFLQGDLRLLQRPALAIVGARNATPAGTDNAQAFAHYLAERGWCVVSGLASGIDAAAHEGALRAGVTGGSTLAVLGTGIDRVYPAGNRDLAHRIAEQGLLLSEFPLGTGGLRPNFPRRNRLVAALARGVLIVEAAQHSGSLITARLAGELGREVFAIPGSIHSPLSRGCHALIRQGAKLVESGQDILEELQPGLPPAKAAESTTAIPETPIPSGITEAHFHSLTHALGYDAADLDTLQARTRWATNDLLHRLTLLELAGVVAHQADGRYLRLH